MGRYNVLHYIANTYIDTRERLHLSRSVNCPFTWLMKYVYVGLRLSLFEVTLIFYYIKYSYDAQPRLYIDSTVPR
jgi:hypothetical protein